MPFSARCSLHLTVRLVTIAPTSSSYFEIGYCVVADRYGRASHAALVIGNPIRGASAQKKVHKFSLIRLSYPILDFHQNLEFGSGASSAPCLTGFPLLQDVRLRGLQRHHSDVNPWCWLASIWRLTR